MIEFDTVNNGEPWGLRAGNAAGISLLPLLIRDINES
jgi:hypothetical protein